MTKDDTITGQILPRDVPAIASAPSQKFCTLKWQDEISHKFIRFTHLSRTGKSEIRISKHETNSNDRNINNQNGKRYHQTAFVLNFEHLNFDIVSACPGATYLDDSAAHVSQVWARDFGFRYSDFHNGY